MPDWTPVCPGDKNQGASADCAGNDCFAEFDAQKQERLIEITADGEVDSEELDDFIFSQEELEKISITVETLQLWSERMLASGKIDADEYAARRNQK